MSARKRLCLSLIIFAMSLSLKAAETPNAATKEVSITIRTDQPQREVPGHFLGLSVEKEQLTKGEFVPSNSALSRLLQNLGAGTIRIGGNSVDYAPFAPTLSQLASDSMIKKKWTITPSMIEEMFHFVKGVNWQVIYGLNLGCFAPGAAAEEAKYVYSVSQGSLLAFEIGNEPDMFVLQGYRKASSKSSSIIGQISWDPASFIDQYHAYRIAVQKAVPDAHLSGPGVGSYVNGVEWLTKFLAAELQGLAFTSTHFYPMVRPDGLPKEVPIIPENSPAFPTISHMLSSSVAQRVMDSVFAPWGRMESISRPTCPQVRFTLPYRWRTECMLHGRFTTACSSFIRRLRDS